MKHNSAYYQDVQYMLYDGDKQRIQQQQTRKALLYDRLTADCELKRFGSDKYQNEVTIEFGAAPIRRINYYAYPALRRSQSPYRVVCGHAWFGPKR